MLALEKGNKDARVIQRIKKILNLADSQNVNEAQAALAKAHELMRKYNVFIRQVTERTSEEVIHIKSSLSIRADGNYSLAQIVAKNFRCKLLIYKKHLQRKPVFAGLKTDAICAKEVFEFASKAMHKFKNSEMSKIYSRGGRCGRYGLSFTQGFIIGLSLAWEKQNKRTALANVVPDEVSIHCQNFKTEPVLNSTPIELDLGAFLSGQNRGTQFGEKTVHSYEK